MSSFQNKLREYARQLIRLGVGLRPGETLVISANIESAPLVRLCAAEAYASGCREVVVGWKDNCLERQRFLNADAEAFNTCPPQERIIYETAARRGTCLLEFYCNDPHALDGVDSSRIVAERQAKMTAVKPYYERLEKGEGIRCTASPPIEATAALLFPELELSEAVEAQWERVFRALKIDGQSDSVAAWERYLKLIERRRDALNACRLRSLRLTNSLGTDLEIRLPKSSVWRTAGGTTACGKRYMLNFPSEEVYTAPEKYGVNGCVYASVPLVYQGSLIEDMRLEFRDGKVVEASASSGQERLEALLSVDEGARHLGEVALVPADSSIRCGSQPWYNPLYDENSSCHLALGTAITSCYDTGQDECNTSKIHIDFMIGSDDMRITGESGDGETLSIFENGVFTTRFDAG